MHEGVNLKLGIIKYVLGGIHHVSVDAFPYSGVQADLWTEAELDLLLLL